MRILLVSQMYPGPEAPTLGTFVADLEAGLVARGHEVARAVVDRRGGYSRHAVLARDVATTARRFRPDVAYAHFLVPAGLLAVLAGRAPTVLTAHGQDVENALRSRIVRAATRVAVRRAAGVVAVSEWLRARLESVAPQARGRVEVVDCGVDLARFAPADAGEARDELGWQVEGTAFVCAGSLTERKNVLRLARAFARHGEDRSRSSATGHCAARSRAVPVSISPAPCPTSGSRAGSTPRTSSASRASSSRSGS